MLFTARSGGRAPLPLIAALLLLRAVALRVVELLALFGRRRLDLRPHDVAHRLDPVGDDVPLLAVPLLDQHGAVAFVVLAADLDRMREALHSELVELRLVRFRFSKPHRTCSPVRTL